MATDTTKNQSWVQKTPGVCGGRACIRNTRITVWGVVNSRRLGAADEQILENIVGSRPRTSTRPGITTESIPPRSLRTFATTRRTDHLWPGTGPRGSSAVHSRRPYGRSEPGKPVHPHHPSQPSGQTLRSKP